MTETFQQADIVSIQVRDGALRLILLTGRSRQNPEQTVQLLDDIVGGIDQLCAIANQLMATLGQRIVNRARQREHLPPLLRRQSGGNQGTTPGGRLDHQHAETQPADNAVAAGKMFAPRRGARRQLGDDGALDRYLSKSRLAAG